MINCFLDLKPTKKDEKDRKEEKEMQMKKWAFVFFIYNERGGVTGANLCLLKL